MRSNPIRTIAVTVLVTSAGMLLLYRWNPLWNWQRPTVPGEPPAAIAASAATQPVPGPDEETNIRVYNKVSPGVVNIVSTVVEYNMFFSPMAREGTGSGSVLDKKGHILTNFHVIQDARNLEVALPDQSKYRARVVGVDSQNDIAVIQLVNAPAEKLHPITLGDSASLKVGQKVLAIGNPFRLQNTLTVGIVSSLGRRIQTDEGYLVENVIQTDAAINPGNSGGPLLNSAGEMVGINTSIFTTSGGNIGIGFAVPVETVKRVVTDLIAEGRVLRPWLGIDGYEISADLAEALELPVNRGVLVARVARGSSAEAGGIRGASRRLILGNVRILVGGDIITHVDGKLVNSIAEMSLALESKRPGESVKVVTYRDGSRIERTMPLVESPRQGGLRF